MQKTMSNLAKPLLLFVCLLVTASHLHGDALSDKEKNEVRDLGERFADTVKRWNAALQKGAPQEEIQELYDQLEGLKQKIHGFGKEAIPVVFETYSAHLNKPDGMTVRYRIVSQVLSYWNEVARESEMVRCLKEIFLRDPDAKVRDVTCQAIYTYGHAPLYRDIVAKMCDDPYPGVGGWAALILERLGKELDEQRPDPETVSLLKDLLKHKLIYIRQGAASGIFLAKVSSLEDKKEAFGAVVEALDVAKPATQGAVSQLTAWTGQYFGEFSLVPNPANERLVKRWKDWWAANKDKVTWDAKKRRLIVAEQKKP